MQTLHELCITMTMRLVAAGQAPDAVEEFFSSPLPGLMACQKAEELAALAVLQLVLLCTLCRLRVVRPEEFRLRERPVFGHEGDVPRSMRAFLPAAAGTAGVPALFSE